MILRARQQKAKCTLAARFPNAGRETDSELCRGAGAFSVSLAPLVLSGSDQPFRVSGPHQKNIYKSSVALHIGLV